LLDGVDNGIRHLAVNVAFFRWSRVDVRHRER
jgi:hypothetical protein